MLILANTESDPEPIFKALKELLVFDRVMILETIPEFLAKYPFVCLNSESTEMEVMRARSRFPSDLGKGLFIGNFVSATNEFQMKQLGIQRVVGLTPI